MFSPQGSKKVMLENYRAILKGKKPTKTYSIYESKPSTAKSSIEPITESSNGSKIVVLPPKASEIHLILEGTDKKAQGCRKIAYVAGNYNIERDGVLLTAFQCSSMEYDMFRILLKRMFWLELEDDEFKEVCKLFDLYNDGRHIDGYEFRLFFTYCACEWKHERHKKSRELNKAYNDDLLAQEKKAKAIADAKQENASDMNFTKVEQDSAMEKLKVASKKYIPGHPSSVGLDGFTCKYVKPTEFRNMIKGTFGIILDKKEMGSLIKEFDTEGHGLIDCAYFLTTFLRMGMSLRHEEKRQQLVKCRQLEIEHKLYYEKLLEEAHKKQDSNFDPTFTEADKESALKKLKKAAIKYSKNHPSSMGLGGFTCKYLTPGAFREMVKVTFQLMLTNRELGALVSLFDSDKNGSVRCDNFLLYFLSLGSKERANIWTASLEKQRRECYEQAMEQERILKAQWERAGSIKIEDILNFTKADEENALKKIAEAARFYDKHASESDLMRAFEGQSMTPSVFKEMMKRCFNVSLTNPELGACLVLFDQRGDRKEIHCGLFCVKFTSLGFEEKEKARNEQRIRRQKALQTIAEEEARKKAEAAKEFDVSVVDYNFTEKDKESGLKKLSLGASRYNKNNPACVSLESFNVTELFPGMLREMIKRTFFVELNPKELGAIVKPLLLPSNKVNVSDFFLLFFELARVERDKFRKMKIASDRKVVEDQMLNKKKIEDKAKKETEDFIKSSSAATDAKNLLEKLKKVTQLFAIDSASYMQSLNAFKAPPTSVASFRDTMYRIFLIRFTPAEIGILMNEINPDLAKSHMVDTISFLKGFFKMARLQEQVLLCEIEIDSIDMSSFRCTLENPPTPATTLLRLSPNKDSPKKTITEKTLFPTVFGNNNSNSNSPTNEPMIKSVSDNNYNPWISLKAKGYLGELYDEKPRTPQTHSNNRSKLMTPKTLNPEVLLTFNNNNNNNNTRNYK